VGLVPAISGVSAKTPTGESFNESSGSIVISDATTVNFKDSLNLTPGSSLYLFGFSTGGAHFTSPFFVGNYTAGVGLDGEIASGLAATNQFADNFTTQDTYFTIGGVGVSGFTYYGEAYDLYVPPVQPVSDFNYTFSLPESAKIVLVVPTSGCCQSVTGIPDLVSDAQGNDSGSNGLDIASAGLTAGSYTLAVSSWNNDGGSTTRADLVGLFAFSDSPAGFIDRSVGAAGSASAATDAWVLLAIVGVVGVVMAIIVVAVVTRRRSRATPFRAPSASQPGAADGGPQSVAGFVASGSGNAGQYVPPSNYPSPGGPPQGTPPAGSGEAPAITIGRRYCDGCGTAIRPGAGFCPNCGRYLP
jgi:hypothetical protein